MLALAGAAALLVAAAGVQPPPAPEAPAPRADAETSEDRARPPLKVWLGVFIENAVDGGIQVVDVVPGGPAARAGLARGDVIIRAGRSDLATMLDLRKIMESRAPGDALSLAVLRDGEPRPVHLVLGAPPPPGWLLRQPAPAPLPAPPSPEVVFGGDANARLRAWRELGLAVERIPPPLQEHLGGRPGRGVLVTRVDPDGPAAGLVRPGDLVVEAEGTPLDGPDALETLLERRRGGRLSLAVLRDRKAFAAAIRVRASGVADDSRSARIRALESSIRELTATLERMRKELAELKSKR